MKYIFIIHSHTLFLSSLGVINKLGLDKKDVIFLFHRHYKTIIPFDYKWIDISEEFERTYYILFSWSRKHFFYNKKTRNEVVGFFDKLIEDNAPNGYNLYSSHLQAFGYQILATNSRCKECFFVQEGGRIMTSVLTDRISFVWKLYNKLVLRNENRLWKCTNWYPSKDTPYNRRVTVYAFDGDYFGYVYPKDNIHIDWPKIDIDVNIDPSCPMFLLDGGVELGQVEKHIYDKALRKMIGENATRMNYIKFHPMQSTERKEEVKRMFKDINCDVKECPMDIPFELIVTKFKGLKLFGFGTSLLFYGKANGHHVVSYEEELMESRRYRLYSKNLPKLY